MAEDVSRPIEHEAMRQAAQEAARMIELQGSVSAKKVARALGRLWRQINRQCNALAEQTGAVSTAEEWLLDNAYLVRQETELARRAIACGKRLRVDKQGHPALFSVAAAAVKAAPDLDAQALTAFLEEFQTVLPLTEQELSLWISAVVWVLTDQLAQLCARPQELREGWEGSTAAVQMEHIFTAMRTIGATDWSDLLERSSTVEQLLRADPSGDYSNMTDESRADYRAKVCRLARKYKMGQAEVARRALELAQKSTGVQRHVGWYLYCQPLGNEGRQGDERLYGAGIALSAVGISVLVGVLTNSVLAILLTLIPAAELCKCCTDFLAMRLTPPRPVQRMELAHGIPASARTLCVVACLLDKQDSAPHLAAQLERYRLANRECGDELRFGLLADLPDSPTPMGEEQRKCIERAQKEVDALNEKYGGGFYLFFRAPVYHAGDERYMGWERKRGALTELVSLLKGRRTSLQVLAGQERELRGTRYVITLDSDTCLNVGAARALVGAMEHPLNRPQIDKKRRVVTRGYGLLQPRIAVDLEAANRSIFSRILAGQGGIDPYASAASDVYHDLYDQASYTGKGIFQVDAFFTCLERRLPENTVLSHDLLEGSYLHAGLLADIELSDGFPYKVNSYFARLHRWVRGDWQLLPWLSGTVPTGDGVREDNPLSVLARWKIVDNLRRSLTPAGLLLPLVLGACIAERRVTIPAAIVLLALMANLLLWAAELMAHSRQGTHTRYHSSVIAGPAGVVLQALTQILFLPYQAFVCTGAALTALWRMYVSRRNLLAWVTAEQAQSKDTASLASCYRKQWFSVLIGAILLGYATLLIGKGLGIIWMLSPLFAWCMSRPSKERAPLGTADRSFLLHQGALIWQYFEQFLRGEDHYLVPDNWQERPAVGLARRTSPTNIGMSLLCAMAAADMDLIARRRACMLIGNILTTMEGLEKWHGHLYNWYTTATAKPMTPRYVSTVDSGNLCGCLIALAQGLEEWGEQELAQRAKRLSDGMDFSILYDADRRLFTIGYDVQRNRATQGWYDLMASEARQTSYLAVARGEVEPRHWRKLGRILLRDNDYSGMASWTGTMFEYFMPNLLLPCERNSMMYESLAFCIYAQKRYAAKKRVPWGISESAFYAFDGAHNYQYKAHGVRTLGLKRGLENDLVIAPYASFLALAVDPVGAVRNLRRLRELGMEGTFGLYEAIDFTPGRAGAQGEVVRSYMAHHLGMSLVAIDNALNQDLMQQRFMRESAMSAYRELLQERLPVGAPVMKQMQRDVPEKPERLYARSAVRTGKTFHRLAPERYLLSNGSYTVLVSDNGQSRSTLGGVALTLCREGEQFAPSGFAWFYRDEEGMLPLTGAPFYESTQGYSWEFAQDMASWNAQRGELTATSRVEVSGREDGERRTVLLNWSGRGERRGQLICYLEPVLARQQDYDAHPAFSRLFLESVPLHNGVGFVRRPRGAEHVPAFAVVWEGAQASFSASRERLPGRGGLRAFLAGGEIQPEERVGCDPEPCLLISFDITLTPGRPVQVRLAAAAAEGITLAEDSARRILRQRSVSTSQDWKVALGIDMRQETQAYQLLRAIMAITPPPSTRPSQSELWPWGVSGDVPIAVADVQEQGQEQAIEWCRQQLFLKRRGVKFDLVLLLDEGGDYRRPVHSGLAQALREMGAHGDLGGTGGIHLLDRTMGDVSALIAWAKVKLPVGELPPEPPLPEPSSYIRTPGLPEVRWEADGAVELVLNGRLPDVGWSQLLCNRTFGWMSDETGSGLIWRNNAREGRLSPWNNEPMAIGGWETLSVQYAGGRYSLFADADGANCTVIYGPGFARWEKSVDSLQFTTTAFVPPDGEMRVMIISFTGAVDRVYLRQGEWVRQSWEMEGRRELVLTTSADEAGGLVTSSEELNSEQARQLLEETTRDWRQKVSCLRVSTPDPALDHYLNSWALYQVIACRLFARTSQYQNGGAYGFRDQLQDVCALVLSAPELMREQIIRACGRQFTQGDVQHWWHPPQGKGVRTRISDDLLWLPYTIARYVGTTGEYDILDETIPFLASPPLSEEEQERYEQPEQSEELGTVYEHGLRAIRCVMERGTGSHGLALFGCGDWNDGMNLVGAQGRGESVWLSWFGAITARRFAGICRQCGQDKTAQELEQYADKLTAAAERAWDGAWYLRGWYDDGTPLGGSGSEECRIDSIAQSFAAFDETSDRDKAHQALDEAIAQLFDETHGVVRLFTPPFTGRGKNPGYISGYHPGMRENGGQYTHGAVWLALACLRTGRAQDGWKLLRAILPEHHPAEIYRIEPYVLAADVSFGAQCAGRGGWSWYTGAAGWYYRTAVEDLLGVQLEQGKLWIRPNLPDDWPGWTGQWQAPNGANFFITVERSERKGTFLDGQEVEGGIDWKKETGEHQIKVGL